MALPIEDYALIGDTETAALVGRDGSIDWLCLPRFDSGACFAALLGTPAHGRWLLAPEARARRTSRRYRGDTLVLETEHVVDGGQVRVVDCMPPRHGTLDVVRLVEGVAGDVAMRMELIPRFDYGAVVPWLTAAGGRATAIAGPDALTLHCSPGVTLRDGGAEAQFRVRAGERIPFILTWHPSHQHPRRVVDAEAAIADTERWWQDWTHRCNYCGPWSEPVMRSLVTLKALTYGPTGGIVAAPTTSLPEQPGGVRNWDYRYCWVRDATITLYALLRAGYRREAAAWRDWLLRAVAGEPSGLQIMYGVAGERRLTEEVLDWLPGYGGAAPVRAGNGAWRQRQLDVYGEVMDTLHHAHTIGVEPVEDAWALQRALMDWLAANWRAPDSGIWEVRGPPRQFTHSKVMAWVALDRAVKDARRYGLPADVPAWCRAREAIHAEVCARGYDARQDSFVQYYGGRALDASLLMIPLVGFLPPGDARVRGTLAAIERRLAEDGLVRRYEQDADNVDGLPPGEGAFLACSFWLADNYLLAGRRREAHDLFERLLALRNDVGLLAEQYDPRARRQLGNFPQAFSHVALVNTAMNLERPAGAAAERRH